MRRLIVQSVFRKELTELLRNRRSLLVMFGVPLLLYPTLTIAVASLTQSKQNEMAHRTAIVGVVNEEAVPKVVELLGDPDNKIAVRAESDADGQEELKDSTIDALLIAPENYEADAIAGKDVDLTLKIDGSRAATTSVQSRINVVLANYQQWIVQQRLAAHGLSTKLAVVPRHKTVDIATGGQEFGLFLASALPLLLLLTGMLGSLYPALSATTTERELGTLETLLVTPATRSELLTAKAGIVLLSGLLTALLNMVSMSLVFARVLSEAKAGTVALSIDPKALALSYLAAVPTLIFFTALVLMVGLLARNLREANAYATPLMMVPIASMLVGIADPGTTPGLLVTPVANTTVIIRAVLTGHASVAAFALAFFSSGLYAGLVLSLAGRVFTNEQLVNPAWEPLSFRGFARRSRRPRWPAVDEALALFAVSLLLNFYVAPIWLRHGLLPLLFGVETLLIAAPAIAASWLGNYPWREVFSIRVPRARSVLGGILLGVGLIPVMNGMSQLQQRWHILPQNTSDMEGMSQLLEPTLQAHPFLAPIVIGLLAGICEELLFRGPIQAALVRRLPIGLALGAGGFLFAAAHMDLSGMPERTILGIILGWIVWRSGSILPAMILHGVYDGVSLAWAAHAMQRGISDSDVSAGALWLGLAAAAVGWMLMRSKPTTHSHFGMAQRSLS
jgi:sodium transport system permease protein